MEKLLFSMGQLALLFKVFFLHSRVMVNVMCQSSGATEYSDFLSNILLGVFVSVFE